MGGVRRLGRLAAWPVRRLLDPRFADVNRHVTLNRQVVHDEGLATRVAVGSVTENVDQVVGTYAATSTESLSFVGAQMRALERRVGDALYEIGTHADQVAAAVGRQAYTERLDRLAVGTIAELDGAAANLLNHAASHRGFAAQAELWMNPPLILRHEEGRVSLSHVNERIVETPFALRALGDVPIGARVLDFGSSENALALSLATMGYAVTALDLRTYPFRHPNLTAVARPLDEWEAEPASFDVILCISTVEHVGLGWYGAERRDERADRRAVERFATLLTPEGKLILTVPYGRPEVDDLQRRYDADGLAALVDGWTVQERIVVEQVDDFTWTTVEDSNAHAAAMLVLRPPTSA